MYIVPKACHGLSCQASSQLQPVIVDSQAALSPSAGLVSEPGMAPSGPLGHGFAPGGFAPSDNAPDGSQVELGTAGSVNGPTGRLTAKNTCT